MSSANRRYFTVSGTPGTGAITVSTAVAGAWKTMQSGDDGKLFDLTIIEGTAWEVARNCTYTHGTTSFSRGTFEESTTGSRLSFTSAATVFCTESASTVNSLSLPISTVTGTSGAISAAVNTLYVADMSGWTADRTLTLPATAAVGDRVGVMVSVGDADYEWLITAASGDTLNAVAGGTEWSRVFITGEVVVMRCVVADTTWVVESDGRIPQIARMGLTTDITTSSAGAWNASQFNEVLISKGCVVSAPGGSTSTVKVRRTGNYLISGAALAKSGATLADQESHGWACTANGNVGTGTLLCAFSSNRTSGSATQGSTGVIAAAANADDLLQHNFFWGVTANAGLRGLNYASFLAVSEVL